MSSTKNRQLVSQRSLERQNSKGDDPWCLTCGVNLAMDGRSYTTISRHNNAEFCDIFARVLGAEFSEDYASNNVCNRCDRHLRRLGRYNSIILARHEGEILREQLDKNLAKHGQKVKESGHGENLPSPTSSTPVITSNSVGRGRGAEGHSSIRRFGKHTTRSVSSVHFEDEAEAKRRQEVVRKFSVPEGVVKKKEPLSPFIEAERRREARRRKWSSASSNSEDNAPNSPPITSDNNLFIDNKELDLADNNTGDVLDPNQLTMSSDQQLPDEAAGNSLTTLEESSNDKRQDSTSSVPEIEDTKMASSEDKEVVSEANVKDEATITRTDTLQADDELFTDLNAEESTPHDNDSANDADVDASDYNADSRSNISEVEERITTKTKFKGAYYNIGSTEDLLKEFADEQHREKAMWSKLTFTESIDVGDSSMDPETGNPIRPPRRKGSGRSLSGSQRRKGGKNAENKQGSEETSNEVNGIREDDESKANGDVKDKNNEPSVRLDTVTEEGISAKYTKDGLEEAESKEGLVTGKKSEKSPLIGKNGGNADLRQKSGGDSKVKDHLPGFLCCNVL